MYIVDMLTTSKDWVCKSRLEVLKLLWNTKEVVVLMINPSSQTSNLYVQLADFFMGLKNLEVLRVDFSMKWVCLFLLGNIMVGMSKKFKITKEGIRLKFRKLDCGTWRWLKRSKCVKYIEGSLDSSGMLGDSLEYVLSHLVA
jgi:hypothetical protein